MQAMAQGRALTCNCESPDCSSRTEVIRETAGTTTVINVIAEAKTVLGDGPRAGYIDGFGVVDAEVIRELANSAQLRMVHQPVVRPAEMLRYQPSAALARWVRMRDLTCRFPGCDRPASMCDLDHTIPFDHRDPASSGLTVPSNLKSLCRQHHRVKTFHNGERGWHDVQLPDGTVVWTSPAGRTYRTTPCGADLFPGFGMPACTAPSARRVTRSQTRAARIDRRRMVNRRQRPVNAAARTLQRARRREVDHRKTRNRMRRMLFLLRDTPSASPFCSWVNDPIEPEELPPDWRPEPQPPLPSDDSPF